MLRLGVVSFLNARPLIDGLDESRGVRCIFDVPAALPGRLEAGEVHAALIPIVDVLRAAGRYQVVSDACIACDGQTLTVRVFSQVPPHRISTLWVDADSHTSVALAKVLWRQVHGRDLTLRQFDTRHEDATDAEALLLIGDKVVDVAGGRFAHQIDLGQLWREHTGLPFVFAVWASVGGGRRTDHGRLEGLLSAARDRGVARAPEIAATLGPAHGWPVDLAQRYLTECLRYRLDPRAIEGANLFARWCAKTGLAAPAAGIRWPPTLTADTAVPLGARAAARGVWPCQSV